MAGFSVGTPNASVTCRIDAWEVATNPGANNSTVRVQITYSRSGAYTTGDSNLTTHIWCNGQDGGPIIRNIYLNSGNGYSASFSQDFVVGHNADGSKTINYCYQASGASVTHFNVGYVCSGSYGADLTLTKFDLSSPPTISGWGWSSHTWNSVTAFCNLSSWGNGGSNGSRSVQVLLGDPSNTITSGTFGSWNRIMHNCGNTMNGVGTITNSDTQQGTGTFTIKGCTGYRLGAYVTNGAKDTRGYPGNAALRYTPPAPLVTLQKTSSFGAVTDIAHLTVIGGDTTNNNSAQVETQVRYYPTYDNKWSEWAPIGTDLPWSTFTGDILVPCNKTVQVQARQVYQGSASETKEISWRTSTGILPKAKVTKVGADWGLVSITVDVGDNHEPLLLWAVVDGNKKEKQLVAQITDNYNGNFFAGNLDGTRKHSVMLYLEQESTHDVGGPVNIEITPRAGFSNLYCSANGKSTRVSKIYASVSGKSVSISKLYAADESGRTHLIYEEN